MYQLTNKSITGLKRKFSAQYCFQNRWGEVTGNTEAFRQRALYVKIFSLETWQAIGCKIWLCLNTMWSFQMNTLKTLEFITLRISHKKQTSYWIWNIIMFKYCVKVSSIYSKKFRSYNVKNFSLETDKLPNIKYNYV